MINVICTITVIAMHFAATADVTGIIVGEGNDKYLVDFSVAAKKEKYDGDYSRRLVNKSDCVSLKNEVRK